MIRLNDILRLTEDEIEKSKCRLMVPDGDDYDPYKKFENPNKKDEINLTDLVFNRSKSIPFKKDVIAIGFVSLGNDNWLFTGIVQVLKDNGYAQKADAKYIESYKKYAFRVVVKYHKVEQNGIILAKNLLPKLEVVEIWPPEKEVLDKSFPGYNNVSVSYGELKNRLATSDEWRAFLKARKGVYLISDTSNGKLYVGSAYGENGIYGRWKTYVESGFDKNEVENGKYPNRDFQRIVKENGMDYIKKNFHYSLLETFADDVNIEYIIRRESWWKTQLLSRDFGYNAN